MNLLGCENAIIDLDTGHPVRPDPKQFIRTVAPFHFDPDAQCSLWEKTVSEILNEDQIPPQERIIVPYVRRTLGYAMSGTARESDFFVWYGKEGRNGKELMLNVIGEVLGPKFTGVLEPELLLVGSSKSKDGPSEAKMTLKGRRIAWATETAVGRVMDVGAMKDFSGGVKLYARPNYKKQIEWYRTHTLFLLTNHLPHINSNSDSEWDRIKLVTFPWTYTNDPDPEKPWQKKKDSTLLYQIRERELPGVFNWLLAGYHDYLKNGLNTPKSVRDATKSYRSLEDSIEFFFQECCVRGPNMRVKQSDLYKVYVEHTKPSRPMGKKKFYQEVRERPSIGSTPPGNPTHFEGIDVKPEFIV